MALLQRRKSLRNTKRRSRRRSEKPYAVEVPGQTKCEQVKKGQQQLQGE